MLVLSGSASTAVRPVLDDPVGRSGVVAATGRAAAYLRFADDVLAVVTAEAVRIPCAVVLAPGTLVPGTLAVGTPVVARGGRLGWGTGAGGAGGVELRASRWWVPRSVAPGARGAPGASALAAMVSRAAARPDPRAEAAVERAAAAMSGRDVDDAARWLVAALGSGRGLTPSADDAAAGLLLAARALAPDPAAEQRVSDLGRRVARAAAGRTTTVSAALLAQAASGRAADAVVDAVDALVGRREPAEGSLARLLLVGHSSGVDTAGGMLAAARHLASTRAATSRSDVLLEPA